MTEADEWLNGDEENKSTVAQQENVEQQPNTEANEDKSGTPAKRRQRGRTVPSSNGDPGAPVPLRPPFELQSPAEQEKLLFKAPIYERLLDRKKQHNGVLPDADCQEAAQELHCHENTVRNTISDIELYLRDHKVRILDALVPYPAGRKKGRAITDEQKKFILGALCSTHQITIDEEGRRYSKRKRYNTQWILDAINQPEFGNTVHEKTLYRFITDITKEDPLVIEYAKQVYADLGKRHIKSKYAHQIKIDFIAPHEVWQCDARAIPMYVLVNGKPCIVTLIVLIDAFSRYVLRWRIVAKVGVDEAGDLKNVEYTGKDFREMVAKTLNDEYVRPYDIYTDNASQFRALVKFLSHLLDHGERPIRLTNTEPYQPEGRGLIERVLGLTDMYFCEFPGFFERDEPAYRERAKQEAELTFEDMVKRFDRFFTRWNEERKNGLPSRRDVYLNTPHEALPAPSKARLAWLACSLDRGMASVTQRNGLTYKGSYEPVRDDNDMLDTLAIAVSNYKLYKTKVPIVKMRLEDEEVVVAFFDGKTPELLQPKLPTSVRNKKHAPSKQGVANRTQRRTSGHVKEFEQMMLDLFHEKLGVNPETKQVVRSQPSQSADDTTSDIKQPEDAHSAVNDVQSEGVSQEPDPEYARRLRERIYQEDDDEPL
jgi:hypothetical protein